MKRIATILAIVVLIGGLVGAISWDRYNTTDRKRDRLVDGFVAILPDSLDDQHIKEIRQLFDRFWVGANTGQVVPEDVELITETVKQYVESGHINPDELVYVMAQVGYYTYKKNPRYNLPGGEVDHPVLNPDAAAATLVDSTFWLEFEEWKRQQGYTDSTTTTTPR